MMQIIFANFFIILEKYFAAYFNEIKPQLDDNYDMMLEIFDEYENNFLLQ